MEDKNHQVVFYGEILPGARIETVKENLARAFKVDKSKIESLFTGKKKVVKKDSSRELCEKTKKIFEAAGAVCAVIPQSVKAPPEPAAEDIEPEATAAEPAATRAPSTPDDRIEKEPVSHDTAPAGTVNKAVLLLLTFFLGFLGIHKFYLARNIQGILYILFSWTGIPGLISLVEFFIYAFASEEQLNSRYKVGSMPLVIIMGVLSPFIFMAMAGLLIAIAVPMLIVSHQDEITTSVKKLAQRPPAASRKTLAVPKQPEQAGTTPAPSEAGPIRMKAVSQDKLYFSDDADACFGKIKGLDFSVEQASLQNGVLHLRQGKELFASREVIIFMFLEDKNISNRLIAVTADKDNYNNPHIHLRWKNDDDSPPQSDVVMKGYDLKLEFSEMTGQTVQGKIDLNIPGDSETRLSGSFTAEVANK